MSIRSHYRQEELPPILDRPRHSETLPPIWTIPNPAATSAGPSRSTMPSFARDLSRLRLDTNLISRPSSGLPSPSTGSEGAPMYTPTSSCRSPISVSSKRRNDSKTHSGKGSKRQAHATRFESDNDPDRAYCDECNCEMPCNQKAHREKFHRLNLTETLQDLEDLLVNTCGYTPWKEQSQSNGQTSGLAGDKQGGLSTWFLLFEFFQTETKLQYILSGREQELEDKIAAVIATARANDKPWRSRRLPPSSIMACPGDEKCARVNAEGGRNSNACKTHSAPLWRKRSAVKRGKGGEPEPDWRECRRLHRRDNIESNLKRMLAEAQQLRI